MEFPWMHSCITTRKGKLNIRARLLHSALCSTNFSMLNILQRQRIQEDSSYCPKRGKWSYNTDLCQSARKWKGAFDFREKSHNRLCLWSMSINQSLPHSLLRWWGGDAGALVLLGPFLYCIEMDLINRTLRKPML